MSIHETVRTTLVQFNLDTQNDIAGSAIDDGELPLFTPSLHFDPGPNINVNLSSVGRRGFGPITQYLLRKVSSQ